MALSGTSNTPTTPVGAQPSNPMQANAVKPSTNIVGAPGAAALGASPQPSALNPFIARDLDCSSDWISMLIYGDYGVGKTYLSGTASFVDDYSDVLYLALEGGEKGLKQLVKEGKRRGVDVSKKIMIIPISTYKQYANIYEFLRIHVKFRDANDTKNLRRLEAQIRGYSPAQCADDAYLETSIPNPKKIKTVITDSLTEAQKYCMYQLLGVDPLTQRLDAEPDQAQFAEWGRSRDMIQFLVRRLRDLPINSIFICGQDIEQDAAKKFHYTPLLPGKLANDVRGLVDCVGYYMTVPLEGGALARRLYLVGGSYGNAHIAAKHRFGDSLKASYIENPTMQDIWTLDNAV
ncbi:MAG: AAA family ATPase [Tannerellaceae bacterium]